MFGTLKLWNRGELPSRNHIMRKGKYSNVLLRSFLGSISLSVIIFCISSVLWVEIVSNFIFLDNKIFSALIITSLITIIATVVLMCLDEKPRSFCENFDVLCRTLDLTPS